MAKFKRAFNFTLLMLAVYTVNVDTVAVNQPGTHHRVQKRSIVSLPISVLKITSQIIVPVTALLNQTNSYLWFDFPTTWPVPTSKNLNTLYNSFGRLAARGFDIDENFVDEQKANQERRSVYQYIEGFFSGFGVDGSVCMQRAICEMSEASLASHGIMGKAIELILTPSLLKMPAKMEKLFGANRLRSNEKDVDEALKDLDFVSAPVDDEYTEAYRRGKEGSCWKHYSDCPISMFKMLMT